MAELIALYVTASLITGFGLCCLMVDLVLTYKRYDRKYGAVFYIGWALIAWPTCLILWEIVVTTFDGKTGAASVGTGAQGIMIGMLTAIPGIVLMVTGVILRE